MTSFATSTWLRCFKVLFSNVGIAIELIWARLAGLIVPNRYPTQPEHIRVNAVRPRTAVSVICFILLWHKRRMVLVSRR